ncbi:amino acid adenylation domain-containing protein [Streptomyces sp. NPDC086554]|uniref:amino acid adenylation domain-containing protein n=1 Tax=Streptomyces sp. NPDC086554 TaxID=3154864 RepID=UPI003434D029
MSFGTDGTRHVSGPARSGGDALSSDEERLSGGLAVSGGGALSSDEERSSGGAAVSGEDASFGGGALSSDEERLSGGLAVSGEDAPFGGGAQSSDEERLSGGGARSGGDALPGEDASSGGGPLSSVQERFWFLDRMHPGTALYNACSAIRLSGPLDPDAAARAVGEIVRRHDVLRARFPADGGVPRVCVGPVRPVTTALIDLTGLHPELRAAEAHRLAEEHARRPFDLETGPLIRTVLLRSADDDHTLLLNWHHIICDGWSRQVFLDEFLELVAAQAEFRAPDLAPLPAQYADLVARRRHLREGDPVYEAELSYWRERLSGISDARRLPPDRTPPERFTPPAAAARRTLDPELMSRVGKLARAERVTPFMVLLTAFAITLSRHLDQDDVLVGTPSALREEVDADLLIGPFLNMLALRTDLSGDPTVRQALARVRETCLGAYEHQEVAFQDIVSALGTERAEGDSQFFGVTFQYIGTPSTRRGPGGLTARAEEVEIGVAKFDLTVDVFAEEGQTDVLAQYDSDLYRAETIDGLLGLWQSVLDDMTLDPEQPVGLIGAIGPEERALLLDAATGATVAPADDCVLDVFEQWAERTPDAPALVHGGTRLSYGELDRAANRLAHRLRGEGVTPGSRVGIYMERSAESVVAVLAVWKAGAAHVPLDLDSPAARRAMIVADAGVGVVVTQEGLVTDLAGDPVRSVVAGPDGAAPGHFPGTRPERRLGPDSLCYVMYTSGSTGRPKGVMATHGSLRRIQLAWEHAFALRGRIRSHLQMANFSFDGYLGELVRCMGSGATLVVCPRETLLLPARLLRLMRDEGVDVADFVPTVLRTLAAHIAESGQDLAFLKLLIVGSDTFPADELERIRRLCGPATDVVNCYGLTEGTIDSTYFTVGAEDTDTRSVLIGTPLPGTEAYLLDDRMRLVPPGVPGTLYIAGPSLTRGYLGAPGRTADAFVPHPFATRPGARMYRTGDRGRYRHGPHGLRIEFLGRRDHQLKVRGYRVELGEIEAAFRRSPSIRDAVVLTEEEQDTRRVHAYLVPSAGQEGVDWHAVVREHLPLYMLPDRLVLLPELPLTPNGKLDRAALPRAGGAEVAPPGTGRPARTPVEHTLLDLWRGVLRRADIGVNDDFFSHGGDSLMVMRVIAAAHDTWGVDITVRAFFRAPTVARLAPLVEQLLADAAAHGSTDRKPGALDRIVPVARKRIAYEEG